MNGFQYEISVVEKMGPNLDRGSVDVFTIERYMEPEKMYAIVERLRGAYPPLSTGLRWIS